MIQEIQNKINKSTEELNKLCDSMEILRAENSIKELKEIELDVAKKMYYREGLLAALKVVKKWN